MADGPRGATGIQGQRGQQGLVGTGASTGPTGIIGTPGNQGPVGIVGARGSTGPTGRADVNVLRAQTLFTTERITVSVAGTINLFTANAVYSPALASGGSSEIINMRSVSTTIGGTTVRSTQLPPGTYIIRASAAITADIFGAIFLSSVTGTESFTFTPLLNGTYTRGGISYINDTLTVAANTNVLLRMFYDGTGSSSPNYTGTKASVTFIRLR